MRVSFVSDVHGNTEGLARVAAGADLLVVLGDLLDYVDYHDPEGGILGAVFGPDPVREFTALRSMGDFRRLRELNRALWASIDDPVGTLTGVIEERYRQVVRALSCPTLLTLGNVDVAAIWQAVAGDELRYLDGEVVTVEGVRFGFVAGGSARPGMPLRANDEVWHPLVRSAEDFAGSVDAVGAVDVLCSHVPPNLPALRYDTIPARLEMFGPGLLESIDKHQPRFAVSGHVHQPLAARTRRGRTECLNTGHFQRRPRALELHL